MELPEKLNEIAMKLGLQNIEPASLPEVDLRQMQRFMGKLMSTPPFDWGGIVRPESVQFYSVGQFADDKEFAHGWLMATSLDEFESKGGVANPVWAKDVLGTLWITLDCSTSEIQVRAFPLLVYQLIDLNMFATPDARQVVNWLRRGFVC